MARISSESLDCRRRTSCECSIVVISNCWKRLDANQVFVNLEQSEVDLCSEFANLYSPCGSRIRRIIQNCQVHMPALKTLGRDASPLPCVRKGSTLKAQALYST